MCIVCGETGHWANFCEKAHTQFKAAKEKRVNAKAVAGNASTRHFVHDLRSQLQHYKLLIANSNANSIVGSDEGEEWEDSPNSQRDP